MPSIQNIKYEKRTRPKPTPANPTITMLLGEKDRSDWVKVAVPKETTAFDIAYEPIQFNSYPKFMPGKTYLLHPVIAEELKKSIKNFEDSIILQMSKKNKAAQEAGILSPDEAMAEENMVEVS